MYILQEKCLNFNNGIYNLMKFYNYEKLLLKMSDEE